MTIPGGRRFLNKLQAMDRREFADRCRQEFTKRADSLRARLHFDFTRNAFSAQASPPGRFFFTSDQIESRVALLRHRLPQVAGDITNRADRILAHRFDLLGFTDLEYGDPIRWHLDAVHSKDAPDKPFYRVPYLDFEAVGDSKITWELNRHQHPVTLAKAYRLTEDRRYANEIFAQWRDWHASNPYPRGINWASSLEVGFRSLSWMWMYYLLDGTGTFPSNFRREWLRAQALNGRHLERYLSTYFSPNTHLLGEGVALFFLGTLCPELSSAKRWKELGWKTIVEESQRQVNGDGFHFEQSTYYHVYALDFFLHAAMLSSRNQPASANEVEALEAVIEKMLNALAQLCGSGPPPRFGDDDGGRVFDPARNRAEHLLDPFALGAILFNRGDFKALAGDLREETIWLTGAEGVERWDRLESKPAPARSAALPDAGLFVMATSAGNLMIDGGSSVGQSRGHDHADALSVCLHSGGRPLLIDPGTCEYVGRGGKRNRFRGTAMHNTLCVDGCDQAEPDRSFSWKQHFDCRAEQWIAGESFDLFVGSHDGYQRLPSPVLHRRWIVALKSGALNSGIFLVRDQALGNAVHQIDIAWHLSPDLLPEGEGVFRSTDSAPGLAILTVPGPGRMPTLQQGVWSPAYGQESAAAVLSFGAAVQLPAEFVSVLVPLPNTKSAPGTLTRLHPPGVGAHIHAYRYSCEGGERIFLFAGSNQPWKVGAISSDAEFVCVSSRPDRDRPEILFTNGSYVEIDEEPTVRLTRKVQRFEWIEHGTFCSDPEAAKAVPAPSPTFLRDSRP